jgi:hypothetical protein
MLLLTCPHSGTARPPAPSRSLAASRPLAEVLEYLRPRAAPPTQALFVTRWTLRARPPRGGGGGGGAADGAGEEAEEEADATPRRPPRSMRRALLLVLQRPERTERTVVVPSSAAGGKCARAGARAGAGAGEGRTVLSLKPAPALNGDPLAEARRDRADAHAARRAVPLAELTRSAGGGWQPWPAVEAEAAPGVAGAGAGPGAGRYRGPPPMLSAAVLRHRRCVSAPCLV